MATIEKLVKAFEALKVFNISASPEEISLKKKDAAITKKEKIQHCQTIADAIIAPNLRAVADFHKFLGIVIETFLMFCDDQDSDVRMIADECLTKIIRALIDSNLGRIQVELYKEIKKNGSSRSLRAALWRFSELCSFIRPQKCRVYIVNLLPCLVSLVQRPEEPLQETLSFAVGKIFPVLGIFMNDVETKMLLKSFMPNLKSSSATTRRTAALCLTVICQNCRKPHIFSAWLFSTLVELLIPIQPTSKVHDLLGVLLSIRNLLPILKENIPQMNPQAGSQNKRDTINIETIIEQYLQVYEILLRFTQHDDHNVVTASLETLQQLLTTPPEEFLKYLINSGTITRSYILKDDMGENIRTRTLSQLSVAASMHCGSEETLDDDPELPIISKTVTQEGQEVNNEAFVIHSISVDEKIETASIESAEDISEYSNIPVKNVKKDSNLHLETACTLDSPDQVKKLIERNASQIDIEYQEVGLSESSPVPGIKFQIGDIGSFIDHEIPLIYCTRLLCSSFLLTGNVGCLMPDKNVRVSVKSLALNCLSSILNFYPEAFYETLFKSTSFDGDVQYIQDILLFSTHSDPRIRGSIATLIGAFLKTSLKKSGCQFDLWMKDVKTLKDDNVNLEKHVEAMLTLIADESSVSCRMGLQAIRSCLHLLLQSVNADLALKILNSLIKIRNNPYWLVKVELLQLLSTINFKSVAFLESHASTNKSWQSVSGGSIQWRIINKILLHHLSDEDHRVRSVASQALTTIIPNMFYPCDNNTHDPLVASSKEKTACFLDLFQQDGGNSTHVVHSVMPPYDAIWEVGKTSSSIEANLSRILNSLSKKLITSTSRHTTFGCIQALNCLSEVYVITTHLNAWSVLFSDGSQYKSTVLQRQHSFPSTASETIGNQPEKEEADLLTFLLSLLTCASSIFDLTAHQNVLQLTGNLLAGSWYQTLIQSTNNFVGSDLYQGKQWTVPQNKYINSNIDTMRIHLMKLLNVFVHVIEEQQPGPPHIKPSLPMLPTTPSLSPVKRRVKTREDSNLPSPLSSVTKNSPSKQLSLDSKNLQDKEKVLQKTGIGVFYNSSHYMKLYEVLRGAYSSYKISLDFRSSEKLIGLLKSCLVTMGQILEISGMEEMGKHAEELLNYLKSVLAIDSSTTIHCVQQLLKSLFGTNLVSWFEGNMTQIGASSQGITGRKPGHATRLSPSTSLNGLYHNCFTKPYTQLTQSLSSTKTTAMPQIETVDENQSGSGWINWLKKKTDRRTSSSSLKTASKTGDKSSLASYIRLFEPLVIKALKQYTVTSSIELQTQVLDLLTQLVYLRVNYCLLDSEQIFLGYVIKQFEYIEEGQIQSASKLISHIFHFLVLLSYEKYHSKTIIGVPKIIQLCDGLMASGQSSIDYVIPALLPIVDDLFQMRMSNKADPLKELETQREVLISMLFRFLSHHQILDMLITVLKQSLKESEDRWKKLSRQIIDLLLPLLTRQEVKIDSLSALNVLHQLFEEVSPSVFRPVDFLLKSLYIPPQELNTHMKLERWICFVFAAFKVLISQSKEEVVLSRIGELGITMKNFQKLQLSSQVDLSCFLKSADSISSPEEIIAQFLFYVIGIIAFEIKQHEYENNFDTNERVFLCQQIAHMLLYITYMFQSGMFRRVANAAMSMIKPKQSNSQSYYVGIQQINRLFLDLSVVHPTLTLQWCNVLILLNYDNHVFWTEVLRAETKKSPSSPKHILQWTSTSADSSNIEMVRKGGLILFCDYVCENPNDAEQMTWLIANHVNELINLSSEPPVHDFICAIHRNSAASGLLIQAVNARCDDLSNPSFVRKTLLNLEAVHISQTGTLLTLLVDKFLSTHQLSIARVCNSMACHCLEILLAESPSDAASQLPLDDVDKLFEIIKSSNIINRHKRLVTLLIKFRSFIAPEDHSPEFKFFESDEVMMMNLKKRHPLDSPSSPVESTLTREWYIGIIRKECCKANPITKVCAKLLSCLEYRDVVGIMVLKEFNLKILHDCLLLGLHFTLTLSHKNKSSPSSESSISSPIVPTCVSYSSTHEYPLYLAARMTLLQHISHIVSLLPRPSQVLFSSEDQSVAKENKYKSRMVELFTDRGFFETLFQIIPVLTCYLNSLKHLPWVSDVPADSLSDISRFCLLCVEATHWIVKSERNFSYQHVSLALASVSTILKNSTISSVIGLLKNQTYTCGLISGVYDIISSLLGDDSLEEVKTWFPPHKSNDEFQSQMACKQIASMISWLEKCESRSCHQIPDFINGALKGIITGLGRLPMVNSHARVPPIVWEMNWNPEFSGAFHTSVPPPSSEFLQEQDVLKQYIFRINTLGWTSRQQFEETWMALLGVLSATPIGSESSEENEERIQTSCLAVKCITALLLQTMMLPHPGNPHNSSYLQQHRNKPLGFIHTKQGKKLMAIRGTLADKLEEWKSRWKALEFGEYHKSTQMFDINFEKVNSPNKFSIGQVSLEYIWTATGMMDEEGSEATHDASSSASSSPTAPIIGSQEFRQREQSLAAYGLDIHSCLHFLLDLYSQWMSPMIPQLNIEERLNSFNTAPLNLLTEVTRSVVLLSDIFTERAQFDWMQNIMLELTRAHPPEDEIITQYLILGICKSAAVVNMETEMVDRLKKLVELSLRSTYLPVRIATLHGLLYILQLGIVDEIQGFIPIAIDYISKHLDNSNLPSSQSEEHVLLMWAVVFYIFENNKEDIADPEIMSKLFQLAVNIVSSQNDSIPYPIYLSIVQGLERLLLTDSLKNKDIDILLKLSKEKLLQQNPNKALPAAGLLVSCMYSVHSEKHVVQPSDSVQREGEVESDHETIITAMERATVLFDRIRKGYPYEAEIISTILPTFLTDFFPSQEILNKVIGEFLSSQQPHPQLMASVVFKVFESLHLQSQQLLIQDWVMLSLSNFTQRSPVSMAIWSLTCFFVSASTNAWLRSLFPLVQQRMGLLESFDCELFCRTALDFRDQLMEESQRRAFKSTIQVVAEPNTPYINLLELM